MQFRDGSVLILSSILNTAALLIEILFFFFCFMTMSRFAENKIQRLLCCVTWRMICLNKQLTIQIRYSFGDRIDDRSLSVPTIDFFNLKIVEYTV